MPSYPNVTYLISRRILQYWLCLINLAPTLVLKSKALRHTNAQNARYPTFRSLHVLVRPFQIRPPPLVHCLSESFQNITEVQALACCQPCQILLRYFIAAVLDGRSLRYRCLFGPSPKHFVRNYPIYPMASDILTATVPGARLGGEDQGPGCAAGSCSMQLGHFPLRYSDL